MHPAGIADGEALLPTSRLLFGPTTRRLSRGTVPSRLVPVDLDTRRFAGIKANSLRRLRWRRRGAETLRPGPPPGARQGGDLAPAPRPPSPKIAFAYGFNASARSSRAFNSRYGPRDWRGRPKAMLH